MHKRIKIAYLFPNFFWIGAQRGAAAVLRTLDRSQFEPMVFVIRKTTDMACEIPAYIPVVELGAGSQLANWRGLRLWFWPFFLHAAIRRHRPDIVVGIAPQCNFVLVMHRLIFGRSAVFVAEEHQHLTTAWRTEPQGFPWPWRWIYRASLRGYNRLDAIRCVSKAAREDFVTNWGLHSDKVHAIYPAFDLVRIRACARDAVKETGFPVVCSVGRLTDQKNFDLLIRAFRFVRDAIPCRLRIAGRGQNEVSLRNLIEELHLTGDVELMGFVDNVEAMVASSTVFVMTSIWEGFPATLVEAMAVGVPVVSVDCQSGPAELIQNGENGLLVSDHSIEKLAGSLITLLQDSALVKRMGCRAAEHADNFGLKNRVAESQQLYLSLFSVAQNKIA